MRKTLPLVVLAAMLVAPAAFAQSSHQENSGAGVAGMPGSKAGPTVTPSGKVERRHSATPRDESDVRGMPGNKSGPAATPPKQ